jgi:hypothetical protein
VPRVDHDDPREHHDVTRPDHAAPCGHHDVKGTDHLEATSRSDVTSAHREVASSHVVETRADDDEKSAQSGNDVRRSRREVRMSCAIARS